MGGGGGEWVRRVRVAIRIVHVRMIYRRQEADACKRIGGGVAVAGDEAIPFFSAASRVCDDCAQDRSIDRCVLCFQVSRN